MVIAVLKNPLLASAPEGVPTSQWLCQVLTQSLQRTRSKDNQGFVSSSVTGDISIGTCRRVKPSTHISSKVAMHCPARQDEARTRDLCSLSLTPKTHDHCVCETGSVVYEHHHFLDCSMDITIDARQIAHGTPGTRMDLVSDQTTSASFKSGRTHRNTRLR